jgi:uncharacterized repeat protein (TIGR03803 family)
MHPGGAGGRLALIVCLCIGAIFTSVLIGAVHAQTFTTIKSFGTYSNVFGFFPTGLVQGPDGTLYGTTTSGELDVKLLCSGNTLYGATESGGRSNRGTIFKLQTDGTGFTVLKDFSGGDGERPCCLTLSGTTLYGAAAIGGTNSGRGTLFKLNIDGAGFNVIKHLSWNDGAVPLSGGLSLSGNTLYGTTYWGGNSNEGTLFRVNVDGSGYMVLKHFGADGAKPISQPILAAGALYGTTRGPNYGSLFRINTDGTGFTVLKNFSGEDPNDLTLSGNLLYGTTSGGSYSFGTIFSINTNGASASYQIVRIFTSTDPHPPDGPILVANGTIYGTASYGPGSAYGAVFSTSLSTGGLRVLKAFSQQVDWANPSPLALAGDTLFGTTVQGGPTNAGTVFKVKTDGSGYVVLKEFTVNDGAQPRGALTLSGNTIYGTTYSGGSLSFGAYGTVFRMNQDGTDFRVLRSFVFADGVSPFAGLLLSGDTLYGTTYYGGSLGHGTLFRISTDGTGYSVLKAFTGTDGDHPRSDLILSNGTLYGTTEDGGSQNEGTVFK